MRVLPPSPSAAPNSVPLPHRTPTGLATLSALLVRSQCWGLNCVPPNLCKLQTGTCQSASTRIKSRPLQLLTFNTSGKEFSVEIRNAALCALGRTGRTSLQIEQKILRAHFLPLLISTKALKSFMVTSAPYDQQ